MSTSGVSTDDVRTALGGIDAEYLPEETIEQAIDHATILVGARIDATGATGATVSDDQRRFATITAAKRIAFMSSPPHAQKSAVDASVRYDVSNFVEELQRQEAQAFATIGDTNRASFRSPRSR